MTKKELIAAIASEQDVNVALVDDIATAIFQKMADSLASGGVLQWPDFGRFSSKARAGRAGRNPSTGKPLTIAATTVVQFKPAATLKGRVHALTEAEQ